MAENKLATLENNNFLLAENNDDLKEIITEELDGLGTIPFDKVKIPAGGGLSFELPGENEDTPICVNDITGIIVDHHSLNAMWKEKYSGQNVQPDCSSMDGKTGVTIDGEMKTCENCPYNQFGSALEGGKGKLCKNMQRLYILRSGEMFPIILVLPPSSLAVWKNYLAKQIVMKKKRPWQVLTKITLKREKSAGGITYSQCVFTKVADISPEECEKIKPIAEAIKATARSISAQPESSDYFSDIKDM